MDSQTFEQYRQISDKTINKIYQNLLTTTRGPENNIICLHFRKTSTDLYDIDRDYPRVCMSLSNVKS